CQQTRKVPWTF
nr:immunoglobulin light chain junction region [Mus musculus]NSL97551.1 immunoglobulin light chain junction region [Mus musculus]NSL98467.1 immunoglobulin light chain junction region [Mus musculus]NSL99932.1 immunoglobulin light chain junction region [Mus musculus]NSM00149.1 immunoglobulin light chain junction region [Mus musculus]